MSNLDNLNSAIRCNNLIRIRECLSQGEKITSESMENFNPVCVFCGLNRNCKCERAFMRYESDSEYCFENDDYKNIRISIKK